MTWEPGDPLYIRGADVTVRHLFDIHNEEGLALDSLRCYATHPHMYGMWACLECESYWPMTEYVAEGGSGPECWCCGRNVLRFEGKPNGCECYECVQTWGIAEAG